MTHFVVSIADSRMDNPSSTQISIQAAPPAQKSAPVSVVAPPAERGPAADEAWFSTDGFPLPSQVNFDDSGKATVQLDVLVPGDVAIATYFASVRVGYPSDSCDSPVFAVEVNTCLVPSLVGMALEQAKNAIQSASLTVGYITGLLTPDSDVIQQIPRAGTVVTAGTAVGLTVSPNATAVSEVRIVNCRLTDEGVWSHDLSTDQWSLLPGSPLRPTQGFQCPSDQSPVLTFRPPEGHYVDLQAADPLIDGDSPPKPTAVGYWKLERGVLLGDGSAPVLEISIPLWEPKRSMDHASTARKA